MYEKRDEQPAHLRKRHEVAQTLVSLGVDLRAIVTYSSLHSGIANMLRRT